MSERPENSDPIRSADHIEDPDQPVDMRGKEHGHPEGPAHRHGRGRHGSREAAGRGAARDEPVEETLEGGQDHGAGGRENPRKVLKETGFPNVGAEEVEALHGRDVDTGPLTVTRKFQPPEGRHDPNMTRVPHAGRDYAPGEAEEMEGAETYGTPDKTPPPEPVRHSRVVEERVQQQERDYDLVETEDGERYVTPHED